MNRNQKVLGIILLFLLVLFPALFLFPEQTRQPLFLLWLIIEFFGLGYVLADLIDYKINEWIDYLDEK